MDWKHQLCGAYGTRFHIFSKDREVMALKKVAKDLTANEGFCHNMSALLHLQVAVHILIPLTVQLFSVHDIQLHYSSRNLEQLY